MHPLRKEPLTTKVSVIFSVFFGDYAEWLAEILAELDKNLVELAKDLVELAKDFAMVN